MIPVPSKTPSLVGCLLKHLVVESNPTIITAGNRCEGFDCQGSTRTPALVYFPPGVYKVSRSIVFGMYTQLAGDAVDWPTLKATSDFGAKVVLDGFPQDSSGRRWNNGAAELNFHKSVRNIKIDVTAVPSNTAVSCINWAVAQATSLSQIVFLMNDNSQHLGVVMFGGGSGIFMGDLVAPARPVSCKWSMLTNPSISMAETERSPSGISNFISAT
jgi:Pectate lyase superfamily protein